jgi:hypothetical protein
MSTSPIVLGGLAHVKAVGEAVSAGVAPVYTINPIIIDVSELPAALAEIAKREESQRPHGWVVAPGHSEAQISKVKQAVGALPVFVVADDVPERFGQPNVPIYVSGLLDGHFRQPKAAK